MNASFANSGNNLGMGVAFVLEDYFNGPASKIEAGMAKLSSSTDKITADISKHLDRLKIGGALTVAGAALLAPFIMNINKASDLNESYTKNAVVFGESVAQVNKFIEQQAGAYGMSKNAASAAVGVYGNLFTALGMGQEKAAGFSVNLTKLAADLASFNNTDIQTAMDALRAGMTGETEPLKKFGVALREELLKQKAFEMGLITSMKGTLDPLAKMQAVYALVMEQTKNAQGDFIRTGDGYANTQRKISARFEDLSTKLGEVMLPLFTRVAIIFEKVLTFFTKFASSDFGASVLKLTAAIGGLLFVGGLALVLYSGMKLLAYQTAKAFAVDTAAKIADTLATSGLTAGMMALASAAWAALAPMLPFIAAGVGIAAALYGIYEVFDLGNVKFEKFSSTFEAIGQIWRSFNGETFTLTEDLAKKLESLGMLDFVLSLGTWLVRIKTFLSGIWQGMSEGFTAVMSVLRAVKESFVTNIWTPITKGLDSIGIKLDKNTSNLATWAKWGKIVGYVIVGALAAVTVQLGIMALASLAAFAAPLAIIATVGLAIYGIVKLVSSLGDVWNWLSALGSKAYNAGVTMVSDLWEGVKSMWDKFATWIGEKIAKIPVLGKLFGMDAKPAGTSEEVSPTTTKNAAPFVATNYSRQATFDDIAKVKANGQGNTVNHYAGNTESIGNITLPIYLDSEKISDKVIEKQEFKNARQ